MPCRSAVGPDELAFNRVRPAAVEQEIETAFVADQDKTDLSQWADNSTVEKPGDLAYWVGYRIAKAYYLRSPDKAEAFTEVLDMSDAKAFLARSGWYRGIQLP